MYGEQAEEEEDKTEKTHGMADTLSLVELVLFFYCQKNPERHWPLLAADRTPVIGH